MIRKIPKEIDFSEDKKMLSFTFSKDKKWYCTGKWQQDATLKRNIWRLKKYLKIKTCSKYNSKNKNKIVDAISQKAEKKDKNTENRRT